MLGCSKLASVEYLPERWWDEITTAKPLVKDVLIKEQSTESDMEVGLRTFVW